MDGKLKFQARTTLTLSISLCLILVLFELNRHTQILSTPLPDWSIHAALAVSLVLAITLSLLSARTRLLLGDLSTSLQTSSTQLSATKEKLENEKDRVRDLTRQLEATIESRSILEDANQRMSSNRQIIDHDTRAELAKLQGFLRTLDDEEPAKTELRRLNRIDAAISILKSDVGLGDAVRKAIGEPEFATLNLCEVVLEVALELEKQFRTSRNASSHSLFHEYANQEIRTEIENVTISDFDGTPILTEIFEFCIDEPLIEIIGNRPWLEIMIQNLLKNAREHIIKSSTPMDSWLLEPIQIHVRKVDDSHVLLDIVNRTTHSRNAVNNLLRTKQTLTATAHRTHKDTKEPVGLLLLEEISRGLRGVPHGRCLPSDRKTHDQMSLHLTLDDGSKKTSETLTLSLTNRDAVEIYDSKGNRASNRIRLEIDSTALSQALIDKSPVTCVPYFSDKENFEAGWLIAEPSPMHPSPDLQHHPSWVISLSVLRERKNAFFTRRVFQLDIQTRPAQWASLGATFLMP